MRNIEEMAAEEEAQRREENWERVRGIFLLLALGLGIWGWYRFSLGDLGSGSFAIILSLIFLALRWNASKAIRVSGPSIVVGLLLAVVLMGLYGWSALPSFYWGKDPAFWLAVHAGAVIEPAWSPLSYLTGEAASFLFPSKVFTLLPLLSAFVIVLSIFVASQEFLSQFKHRGSLSLFFVFILCLGLGLSKPFWTAATMGIGLVSGLGLLLFLLLRHTLQLGKDQITVSTYLLGLLWATHPLWGLAGTAAVLLDESSRRKVAEQWLPFALGLSPYFWIFLRIDENFPSWGGEHPYWESVKEVGTLWLRHFQYDWYWPAAVSALGWSVLVILILAGALGLYNLLMGVEMSRKLVTPIDFWVWALCGLGMFFFYSNSTDLLAPTGLWFVTGAAGFLAFSFDRRAGGAGSNSKWITGLVALIGVLAACALSWLPGQSVIRNQYYFPQQHALNLVRPLGPQTVLVCDDPFEFYSASEVRWMETTDSNAYVLNSAFLNERWYISQWIDKEPRLLFSTMEGATEQLVKSLVLNNRDLWQVQWSCVGLPGDWTEPVAIPAGLTYLFQAETGAVDPASFQYHYDLSLVPIRQEGMDIRTAYYLSRYVKGFDELGRSLVTQERYSDAIRAYDRAERLDPTDQEAMNGLSQIYSQHNLLEAAQLDYEKTVKTYPALIGQMMKSLDGAQAAQDESKAADTLGQLVKLNTELADAQYQLSKIYEKQGRLQESKALLEASVQVNPKQVEAQLTLGHSMEKSGDLTKAEEAFRSVLLVDPQNKEAQLELWKLINKPKR